MMCMTVTMLLPLAMTPMRHGRLLFVLPNQLQRSVSPRPVALFHQSIEAVAHKDSITNNLAPFDSNDEFRPNYTHPFQNGVKPPKLLVVLVARPVVLRNACKGEDSDAKVLVMVVSLFIVILPRMPLGLRTKLLLLTTTCLRASIANSQGASIP